MSQSEKIDYDAFRQDVRNFLKDSLTDDLREAGRLATSVFPDMPRAIEWQKIRHAKGWAAPSWPAEYGGPGWNERQRQIWEEENVDANAPGLILQGLAMCGPCLMGHGTREQKDYYLPRMLAAEHIWCQGYSEPGAGSDLASLKTSAVADGDDYIINGSKIWTSNAHEASHMFCLVRTSTQGRPQQGISFLLLEMNTPGITVEPIHNLNGLREQNQVFFDNVRVPQANRVGKENEGWTVAKYLLEFERGGVSRTAVITKKINKLKQIASDQVAADGTRLIDNNVFRCQLAEREIEALALNYTGQRILAAAENGGTPGVLASLTKISSSELGQDLEKMTTRAVGLNALHLQPAALVPGANVKSLVPDYAITAMPTYLDGRASTIAGGSGEVQRGIIAKAVLGL